jgi:hypothetical protein
VSGEGFTSRIRGSGKAAQILEEGNGSLERERERERGRDGWGEARRARSVPGVHLIRVTAPKC